MGGDHDALERGSVSPSWGAAAAHAQISTEAAAMPALQAEWQDSSCGQQLRGQGAWGGSDTAPAMSSYPLKTVLQTRPQRGRTGPSARPVSFTGIAGEKQFSQRP